jgi:hypothetical protein
MSARAGSIRAPRATGLRARSAPAWIAPACMAALIFLAAPTGTRTTVAAGIPVLGATPSQERIVTWAVGRYEAAGLELPAIAVGFHSGPEDCANNSGVTVGGRIDICTTGTRAYVRATLLHEMAHVWLERYLWQELRTGFLLLRGLQTWGGLKGAASRGQGLSCSSGVRPPRQRLLFGPVPTSLCRWGSHVGRSPGRVSHLFERCYGDAIQPLPTPRTLEVGPWSGLCVTCPDISRRSREGFEASNTVHLSNTADTELPYRP